jgi:hypothetical protein
MLIETSRSHDSLQVTAVDPKQTIADFVETYFEVDHDCIQCAISPF